MNLLLALMFPSINVSCSFLFVCLETFTVCFFLLPIDITLVMISKNRYVVIITEYKLIKNNFP